jgi:sigma-E factor negative regulatory protein RseC
MMVESGWVTAVEPGALWVETIQRSTCDSCSAKKGCGQRVLAQLAGHTAQLRVAIPASDRRIYASGDRVDIGIAEHAVVVSSLLVYLLPLGAALLFGALVESSSAAAATGMATPLAVAAASAGLLLGAVAVRRLAARWAGDQRFAPVLLGATV